MDFMGIETQEDSSTDEKVGEERLGSSSPLTSFGPTLVLATIAFILLVAIVVVIIIVARRYQCSEKNRERVKKVKRMVFFNPIIRYLVLNSLKLNMTGLLAIKLAKPDARMADFVSAIGTLAMVNLAPLVFLIVLVKQRQKLKSEQSRLSFGALYNGKNVKPDNKAYLYPLIFFWRRCGFIAATIYLFEYPLMQMFVHHFTTMLMVGILAVDLTSFVSKSQYIVEIGSEFFLHTTSILLSQNMNQAYSEGTIEMCELFTLGSLGILIILNVVYIIYVAVTDCKEKRRLKAIEKRK